MTDPGPARPVLSASGDALLELASCEQYRAAHRKRQAGERLTAEEEQVLASVEELVQHLDEKASRAEALARATRSNGWLLAGALTGLGLLLGGMLSGGMKQAAERVGSDMKEAAKHVGSDMKEAAKHVGSGLERSSKNLGNVERAAKSLNPFGLWRKEPDS
ncbi:hypothetical protein ABPG77_002995 [Micractinium sp. CCAP 211/92]